ncbi:alcohol dehydrogenase catalytic domain-containing protein [Nitriliruptoraceae bacterium ZYF776]|nr:alcohol dehydrogenase catalytic domain-containing protein [Profundirhabdus halotolerans]
MADPVRRRVPRRGRALLGGGARARGATHQRRGRHRRARGGDRHQRLDRAGRRRRRARRPPRLSTPVTHVELLPNLQESTVRAVRTAGVGSVALVDIAEPTAGPGEIVLEVAAAAVCNTDRKLVAKGTEQPRTLGHELTGHTSDGTLVGVHPEVSCQRCEACLRGWENRCPDRVSLGIGRDGGLAERIVVPADRTVEITGLDPVVGAMLEPLATVVHAVELTRVEPDARALVVGGGVMGVLSAWVLAARTATVGLLQRSQPRRQLAVDLGIDRVVARPEDVPGALGGAPDLVVVTAPGAAPLAQALELVRPGGTVHAFAGSPGGAPVDANLVHYRHLTLVGSTGSRLTDYRTAAAMVAAGEVPLGRLPHRTVALDELPHVLTADTDPTVLKTVAVVTG